MHTAGVSVLSAAMAAFSKGIAFANSVSHSFFIVLALSACLFATASSALTTCQSKKTHQPSARRKQETTQFVVIILTNKIQKCETEIVKCYQNANHCV